MAVAFTLLALESQELCKACHVLGRKPVVAIREEYASNSEVAIASSTSAVKKISTIVTCLVVDAYQALGRQPATTHCHTGLHGHAGTDPLVRSDRVPVFVSIWVRNPHDALRGGYGSWQKCFVTAEV
ncbi:uncharacterized protein B0I36DRAFT_437064 [Microdochium trichocladiopsis]|uniref:Uncharacterized protein n=1 Tax=Microdochium trichocladiopsis TaxID=1682393 RepID=A0A9P9BH45_9PEZI|nr:uncharacterized protein B0I36DRAFT_437064 [Microdochium trichocladiopsis]KAH7009251.1 hypothetical protein B0I36DRAFT_437064 [Microdochium trichocladiopsis]